MNWKGIVGKVFSPDDFIAYCDEVTMDRGFHPRFVALHNTGVPTLAQWKRHAMADHLRALQHFYRDMQHWSAGPHLFVDHQHIGVFTPLDCPGVHSPSWNAIAWGVEMAGDYATEAFDADVKRNAVVALAALCRLGHLDPRGIRLHKEDPRTTHNCPGKHVVKADIIAAVIAEVERQEAPCGEHSPAQALPDTGALIAAE